MTVESLASVSSTIRRGMLQVERVLVVPITTVTELCGLFSVEFAIQTGDMWC